MSSELRSQSDLYAYDGSGKPAQQCDSREKSERCSTAIQNWRPDTSLCSPEAREWHKQNQQTRNCPLERNTDGTYTVKHGDCLDTIAERALRDAGQTINKRAIACEAEQIIALNRAKYPDLDCNKEFLADGWRLRLPECKTTRSERQEPVVRPQPCETPVQRPEPCQTPVHHKRHPSPAVRNDDNYYERQPVQQQRTDNSGAALAAGLSILPLAFGAAALFGGNRRERYYEEPGYYGGYNGYNGYNQQQQFWQAQHQREEWRERQEWRQRHAQHEYYEQLERNRGWAKR